MNQTRAEIPHNKESFDQSVIDIMCTSLESKFRTFYMFDSVIKHRIHDDFGLLLKRLDFCRKTMIFAP